MFTGIVQVVGKVQDVRFPPGHTPGNVVDGLYTLVIEDAGKILESASIGDSVAVDGTKMSKIMLFSTNYFLAIRCVSDSSHNG